LLGTLRTVTTTGPDVTLFGRGTTMLVALQVVGVGAAKPLNVTVLVPWFAPKPLPLTVIGVIGPAFGEREDITGAGSTTK
jgi:hypothetical protein